MEPTAAIIVPFMMRIPLVTVRQPASSTYRTSANQQQQTYIDTVHALRLMQKDDEWYIYSTSVNPGSPEARPRRAGWQGLIKLGPTLLSFILDGNIMENFWIGDWGSHASTRPGHTC
jgi:hypothetical protein